jgi:hypothetical protein
MAGFMSVSVFPVFGCHRAIILIIKRTTLITNRTRIINPIIMDLATILTIAMVIMGEVTDITDTGNT